MLRQMKSPVTSHALSGTGQSPVRKDLFLCIFSALLLTLPFSTPNLWIFAWVGFVPLFFALQNKAKGRAFLLAYLTGTVFWLGTIYWLTYVTLAGYILLFLYLALYFGLFGLIIRSYKLEVISYKLFFIPAVWVVLEYIRGHFLTGFPWTLLAYSQYKNLPIIQITDITGAYGVSFLVMMGNVLIWLIISENRKQKTENRKINFSSFFICPLSSALCLLIAFGYGYYKLNSPLVLRPSSLIRISVVQPNIPQELKWSPVAKEDIVKKYFRITQEALKDSPDLIIWPESAVQDYLVIEKGGYANADYLADFTQEINKPLLLGMVGLDSQNFYNSAVLFSQKGEIVQRYDKLHLVPFGEFIPLRAALPFLEVVVPIGDFTAGKEYVVFEASNQNPETRNKFSVLICFEDVFPSLARNFVKNGANFLVNITNDAWFGDTSEPFQHLAASVFRAVENRVSVVRAANTGISCFISPLGEIKTAVKDMRGKKTFIDGYISDTVFLGDGNSFYTRFGDVFALFCFIVIGCGIIMKVKSKNHNLKLKTL
ncbi:MAG: apolipoprotein N-acyltransferase [Candidatus Omnitrophota bacterium]|nr:apolipoprotein N-acyltransferase [Candidatus Omnitrophota bacterium]